MAIREFGERKTGMEDFTENLAKGGKEFDERMNKKVASIEIITKIRKYAVGILTGNNLNSYALEKLVEKAKSDEKLSKDEEIMNAIETVRSVKKGDSLDQMAVQLTMPILTLTKKITEYIKS